MSIKEISIGNKIATLKNINNQYTVGTPEGTLYFCEATPKYEVSESIAEYLGKQTDYRNDPLFIITEAPVTLSGVTEDPETPKKVIKKAIQSKE